jgi:hypothetical protein
MNKEFGSCLPKHEWLSNTKTFVSKTCYCKRAEEMEGT